MPDSFTPPPADPQEFGEIPDDFEGISESSESAEGGTRPEILVEPGRLPELATAGEAVLIAAGAEVFQRGGVLVRPASFAVRASGARETVAVGLRQVTAPALIDRLARAAVWQRPTKKDGPRTIDPPGQIATIILSRAGEWRFPSLAGVAMAPTLRRDGTLLTAPGYDPESRMFLALPPGFRMPPIPDDPTKADAKAALGELDALLSGFPFVTDIDRSVALSMLMTPVLRPAMDAAPFHFTIAPTPGSGKSYLVDLASAIATGQICPVSNVSRNLEELEKNLTGLLLDGFAVVSLDNIESEVGGSLLCQATERPMIRLRPLGTSQIATIENTSTIFGTGNNARVTGDMVRRALTCNLDAGVERPELRKFDFDPLKTILNDRGTSIAAIMTIARAYQIAGCPDQPGPIASYVTWGLLVRDPLIWLGRPDPAAAMERSREDDPELAELRIMLAAWAGLPGARAGLTVRETITLAEARAPTVMGEPAEFAWPELAEALAPVCGDRGGLNANRLGYWLRGRAGRVVAGRKFIARPAHANTVRWAVTDA
jgi:hypothetical protein